MGEKAIVNAILKYLKIIGAKAIKIHGTPFSRAGTPDIVGAINGRPLALEVKRPGEEETRIQAHELRKWKEAGAITGVVTSVAEAKEILCSECLLTPKKGEPSG